MSIQPDHRRNVPDEDVEKKYIDDDQQIEASRPVDYQAEYDAVYANKEIDLAHHEAMLQGEQKFNKLGWKKLTICLIVKAIALGALSMPSAFRNVGMVAGILLTVGIGLIAIYTSYVVGQVAVKYPHVKHYADAVRLIWGRFGYELCGFMFCCYLSLLVGSHALTGTISFIRIVDTYSLCAVVWGVISAIILFVLALPPSFSEFAILGYIDFGSIIAAIGITIIATGITSDPSTSDWSAWPPEDMTLKSAFLSTTNIVLAYSFAVSQFSFMAEMHTPKDYVKSIWALGLMEIVIYTVTGATIYAFVGQSVQSPALLSAGFTVSRVAFGVALPVTFISGSISATVVGRYVLGRAFPNSPIQYVNTKAGWMVWLAVIAAITVVAFIIAEAVPFFNTLLGLISSLFISGFTFYFPSLFWFMLIKEGKWNANWHNIGLSIANVLIGIIGLAVLGLGTWASVQDIVDSYAEGSISGSFTCDSSVYA